MYAILQILVIISFELFIIVILLGAIMLTS